MAEHDQIAARFFYPGNAITDLLNAEMDRLFAALNRSVPVFSERAFQRFVACVRMTLRQKPPDESTRVLAREALFDRIREYIAAHIARPTLGTEALLKRFGASRASLYRMFAPFGGVRAYISHQRLIRAALDLATRTPRRGQIKEKEERWGFTSGVHFNRSVRTYFGTSPGELFGAPISPPPHLPNFEYLDPYVTLTDGY